jgi:hypothetical protein
VVKLAPVATCVVNPASEYHFNVPPLPLALKVTEPEPHRLAPVVVGAAGIALTVAVVVPGVETQPLTVTITL